MGLLTMASNRKESSLDEKGKALITRIKKLIPKKSTPYTALSLLKAYGSFNWGICLVLKNKTYISYTSVGFGIGKIFIDQDKVWFPEKDREKFFKLENREQLDIKSSGDCFDFWVFPLQSNITGEPWSGIMLLGVSDDAFEPEKIAAILSEVIDKFFLPEEFLNLEPLPEDAPTESTSAENIASEIMSENNNSTENISDEIVSDELLIEEIILTSPEISSETTPGIVTEENDVIELNPIERKEIEEKITLYHQTFSDFNCIIFELSKSASEDEKSALCSKLITMIGKSGTVISLPAGRSLILLPLSIDRELISHRLMETLKIAPVLSFETSSPDEVMSRINSLNV